MLSDHRPRRKRDIATMARDREDLGPHQTDASILKVVRGNTRVGGIHMSVEAGTPEKKHESIFEWFFHSEVSGSFVLMACAVLALILANSPLSDQYFAVSNTYVGITWGETVYKLSVEHWIKDGLMAIFFFVVGLEIKRELVVGELSSVRQAMPPGQPRRQ